jgi:hypothetical protein
MVLRRYPLQAVHQGQYPCSKYTRVVTDNAKDMPASRGKALPLLRIINSFLRFLPRTPADLVFRGRVHQFASSVISVADKSAINMRGDYNDIKTTWDEENVEWVGETAGPEPVEAVDEGGDIKMATEGSDVGAKEEDQKQDVKPGEWCICGLNAC